jgi:hypothetical protein
MLASIYAPQPRAVNLHEINDHLNERLAAIEETQKHIQEVSRTVCFRVLRLNSADRLSTRSWMQITRQRDLEAGWVGIGYQDPMDAGSDDMFAKGSNLQAVARDRLHAIEFEFPTMPRADGVPDGFGASSAVTSPKDIA